MSLGSVSLQCHQVLPFVWHHGHGEGTWAKQSSPCTTHPVSTQQTTSQCWASFICHWQRQGPDLKIKGPQAFELLGGPTGTQERSTGSDILQYRAELLGHGQLLWQGA